MQETQTAKQLFVLIQKADKLTTKLLIYSYLVWQRRYGKPTTLYLLRKDFGFRPGKIKEWIAHLKELGLSAMTSWPWNHRQVGSTSEPGMSVLSGGIAFNTRR